LRPSSQYSFGTKVFPLSEDMFVPSEASVQMKSKVQSAFVPEQELINVNVKYSACFSCPLMQRYSNCVWYKINPEASPMFNFCIVLYCMVWVVKPLRCLTCLHKYVVHIFSRKSFDQRNGD
jgi:hypothetical protein